MAASCGRAAGARPRRVLLRSVLSALTVKGLSALVLLGLFVCVGGGELGADEVDGAAGDAFVQFLLDMQDTGRVLPVEASRLVLENDRGKLILVERHTDGGALIPGRSTGNFDVKPYVSLSTRRGAGADARGIRAEWKVGNCEVGSDSAFSVALLDGWPIGSCWSPHCYTHLLPPGAGARGERGGGEIAIVLLQMDKHGKWVKTSFGARAPLTWPDPSDKPQLTSRQQTCLPEPAASAQGELYVVDIVYSLVHRQLVLFGPTHKPLGGLYCEWDGNPQTSKTARKVCHPGRIAPELQQSWIWTRPPDGSWVTNIKGRRPHALNASGDGKVQRSMIYQCVFAATSTRGIVVSNATLIEDNQHSTNLASCFPPDDIRLLLTGTKEEWIKYKADNIVGDTDGQTPWTGGEFVFRAWDEMSGEILAEVVLRLCPFMVSSVKRWEHEVSICAIFRDQALHKFSKVISIVLSIVEYTRALTLENLCILCIFFPPRPGAVLGRVG